jgi:hypothetical protein
MVHSAYEGPITPFTQHFKDIAKVLTAVSPQQNGLTNFSIAEQKGIYANFVSTAQKLKIQGEGL